jgi:low affinity Fe/Cu permease
MTRQWAAFHYSDTWQVIVSSTIVMFQKVFLIQNTPDWIEPRTKSGRTGARFEKFRTTHAPGCPPVGARDLAICDDQFSRDGNGRPFSGSR